MSVKNKEILKRVIAERMADNLVDKYIDAITITEESAYRIFFRKMMVQHGMKNLKGVSKDRKKAFFADVRRRWHAISGKIGKRKIYEMDLSKGIEMLKREITKKTAEAGGNPDKLKAVAALKAKLAQMFHQQAVVKQRARL